MVGGVQQASSIVRLFNTVIQRRQVAGVLWKGKVKYKAKHDINGIRI